MHTQVLGLGAVAAVVLALTPVAASAATSSDSSAGADASALVAYHAYLSALMTGAPSAAARDTQLVDGVANTCADALSDLSKLSSTQLDESALTAFGNEVDADLDLAYVSGNPAPLNRLAGVLDALTWSTTTQLNTTMHLISGERTLQAMAQSHLCPDAIALDAVPLSEPASTRQFLNRYGRASAALNLDLSAFQTLLAKFETKSESKLVDQINAQVSGYSAESAATEQTAADTVLSELGIDS